jgi:glycosyltransferase involved in cell wall biosynthesis
LLRIAHVISTPEGIGGAEQTLSQLVRYGAGEGWDQLVLNPFARSPHDEQLRSLYAPAAYQAKPGATWSALPSLRRWLIERLGAFRPQIVHVHLFHASALVASIPRPAWARLVLSHQHGDHFQATGARFYEVVDRLAGRRYDQVVACSQSVEDFLLYRYGYPAKRVTCVRNGWSGNPIERNGTGRSIICVARFRKQKNHAALVDAVSRVRGQIPDVRLSLVGDGETRADVEGQVMRLGLEPNVEFLGDVRDVWPLLARARVFALPSTYEPLGISALEAMAAGLPVVASAVGGLREIVTHEETGFLCRPGDTVDLTERLTTLLKDDDLASRMGHRARAAANSYTVERTTEGYSHVYERLLDRQHA